MKFQGLRSVLHLCAAALSFAPAAFAMIEPAEVTNLFVPNGFGDNNEVVVVADGYLPDPCYKLRTSHVAIDSTTNRVIVTPMMERLDGVCPDVTVPYQTVIPVGHLARGNYSVEVVRGGSREPLVVKPAVFPGSGHPGHDDYLYAPIDAATVSVEPDGATVHIRGRLTNSCLTFRPLRFSDSGRTFEVLPIVDLLSSDPKGGPCRAIEKPFEKVVKLPQRKPGRYLVHVRSMNGQSVNEVFGIY